MGVTLEVALGMQTMGHGRASSQMTAGPPNNRGLQLTMAKIAETSGIRNLVRQCRFGVAYTLRPGAQVRPVKM